jgi:hypothetical protein
MQLDPLRVGLSEQTLIVAKDVCGIRHPTIYCWNLCIR